MSNTEARSLEQWMDYAQTVHFRSIDLTLDRVDAVYQRLKPDWSQTCIITVGGTNGKGSSVAMLESIYNKAGYSTAAFTSPHLIDFNERYRFNRQNLSDEKLIASFAKIEQLREQIPLTYFEFATLVAIDALAALAPDVLIMETGMGGRLDSVNILDPDCVLLTHVALDHTQWLGDTREKIGAEKAGLMRPHTPVIFGDLLPPDSVLDHAQKLAAELKLIKRDYDYSRSLKSWDWHGSSHDYQAYTKLPLPCLSGSEQVRNAAGVLMAVHCLQEALPVAEQSIRQGLQDIKLSGRLQQLEYQGKAILLDVAHNADAVAVLDQFLEANPVNGKTYAVFSMLEDKDIQQVVTGVCSNIDNWALASLDEPRGLQAQQLAQQLFHVDASLEYNCHPSPQVALDSVLQQATADDRVVVFGSFHTVGEILATLRE